MYISDYLGIGYKGHTNFDFVDVCLDNDNLLFIDPCLIERSNNLWGVEAAKIIKVYFDCFYEVLRNNPLSSSSLFQHAHEPNATKLGYGNGENGKGKTSVGLVESLTPLKLLVQDIPTISISQDIPVLVVGFAEDSMSDLLTNILHDLLNRFTAEQMEKYAFKPNGEKKFWTWNEMSRDWMEVNRPCWTYNNKELLLVPKCFVRKNFLFKAHQYFYGVIIERLRNEQDLQGLKKIDIWNNIPRPTKHWEYEFVINYTKKHPDALLEYHGRLPKYYARARGCMSDEDLDKRVYNPSVFQSA